MNETPIIFSPLVIKTVNALSESDRKAIATALINEFILDLNPDDALSPFQAVLYTMISHYVKRDSIRGATTAKNAI